MRQRAKMETQDTKKGKAILSKKKNAGHILDFKVYYTILSNTAWSWHKTDM